MNHKIVFLKKRVFSCAGGREPKGTKASTLGSGTWIPCPDLYLTNNVSLGMLFGFSAWFHQQNQEGQQHLAGSYGTRSTDILTAIPTLQVVRTEHA